LAGNTNRTDYSRLAEPMDYAVVQSALVVAALRLPGGFDP
jgi:hypothetical protein